MRNIGGIPGGIPLFQIGGCRSRSDTDGAFQHSQLLPCAARMRLAVQAPIGLKLNIIDLVSSGLFGGSSAAPEPAPGGEGADAETGEDGDPEAGAGPEPPITSMSKCAYTASVPL